MLLTLVDSTKQPLRKVPEVTIYFWIIKLLSTAIGESTSDYLVYRYNPYLVVILGFSCFILVLALQFRVRRYIASVYWLTVTMVAVFGTMAADVTHVALGVPYFVSAIVFTALLAGVFYLWNKTEGSLSIHSILTRRREMFYWATVLTTFALGTAAGDLTAYTAHLGFLTSGLLFGAIFIIPALGLWLWKWNAIFSFWFAYIFTRPFGASFADWTGKAHSYGGLGWGNLPVIATLGALITILIFYLSVTKLDVTKELR
jgi:uncharacterized membrane-anchored protein